MTIDINKDGIHLLIEGENVTQEMVNGVVEAVFGRPKVDLSGEIRIDRESLLLMLKRPEYWREVYSKPSNLNNLTQGPEISASGAIVQERNIAERETLIINTSQPEGKL